MPLRIGCDLDGVLADMETALIREAEALFGPSITNPAAGASPPHASMADLVPPEVAEDAPLQHELHLSSKQRRKLWAHVSAIENFWESLEETEPGIVARLAALAAERRWEVIFLTRRPATTGALAQVQSQRWLESKGFRLPSVYVVTASRGLIAAGLTLDIVIDDTPENCVDVASDSRARTIGVFRNQDAPVAALKAMGIHIVKSTGDALDVLVAIDSSIDQQQPGAIERVMKTLGLKPTTTA